MIKCSLLKTTVVSFGYNVASSASMYPPEKLLMRDIWKSDTILLEIEVPQSQFFQQLKR